MKSSQACPFGPDLQLYWDKRYDFFSKWDEGIQTDREGLYSVIAESVAKAQAAHIKGVHVIDAFTGIGGCAIAYARAGKHVTAIELDPNRLKMAEHNARIYGVSDLITFIQGDFFEVAPAIQADAINLDPPWGGPSYKERGVFKLENFSPDGNKLLSFALSHADEVLLRVPRIFDMDELRPFGQQQEVIDDVLHGHITSRSVFMRN